MTTPSAHTPPAAEDAASVEGPPVVNEEELLKALADTKAPELQEMAKRLAKSRADMENMIVDLEAEQKSLKDENAYLRDTIELMMKELQKLHIGAFNTVEPEIEGGPLDFVARYWEKVRPRDTAVQIDEHTGEIKKPVLGEPVSPQSVGAVAQQLGGQLQEQVEQRRQQALELGKQATEQGKQVWGRLSQSLGPLWQRAESLLADSTSKPKSEKKKKKTRIDGSPPSQAMMETIVESNEGVEEITEFDAGTKELAQKICFGNEYIQSALNTFFGEAKAMLQPEKAVGSQFQPFDFRNEGIDHLTRLVVEVIVQQKTAESFQVIWKTRRSALSPVVEVPVVADAAASTPEPATNGGGYADAAVAPAPVANEAPVVVASTPAAEEPATASNLRAPGAEDQISSTILIEAQLKIDDGSVHTLQVRAADRCKEVATRFVQEHSLKAWFVDPLTAWLKKVEADADKFPVTIEGDLIEIRKAHAKGK